MHGVRQRHAPKAHLSELQQRLASAVLAGGAALLLAVGCGASSGGATPDGGWSGVCGAGASQACTCSGASGVQTCNSDGTAWGACDCGAGGGDASVEASPGLPDGATGPAADSGAPAADGATTHGESASCSTLTGKAGSMNDASGGIWTLVTGSDGTLVVDRNGAAAGYTDKVTELAYVNHVVSQQNSSNAWWSWIGGAWVSAGDPTLACGDGGGGGADAGPLTGNFHVVGGQIIDPKGKVWLGRGINIYDNQLAGAADGSGNPVLGMFPKLGIVRVPCYSFTQDTPAFLQAFITTMTSRGIVVELEDHTSSDGGNAGGSTGTVFTGQQLTDELAWFTSIAKAFAGNPYVWFGTDNEPSENPSAAALSTWQQQTVQAIRGAGNSNIVMVEMNCDSSSCASGYTASVYAAMTNIVWDMHYYGWLDGYNADQTTVSTSIADHAHWSQALTSADGTVPIVIGEYGNSTNGSSVDANGSQVVAGVGASGYPSMAWVWNGGGTADHLDNGSQLTSYGQQVASIVDQ